MSEYIMTRATRQLERVQIIQTKSDIPDYSKAKSYRGLLQGAKLKFAKDNSAEAVQARLIIEYFEKGYNHFHPETKVEVEIDSWHGKSSFEIIRKVDSIVIVKYQKKAKGEEPTKIETEVSNREMTILETVIKHLWGEGCKGNMGRSTGIALETKDIAEKYCFLMHYQWNGWKMFFADRKLHNKLTLMLGALDSMKIIKYNGGKTILL